MVTSSAAATSSEESATSVGCPFGPHSFQLRGRMKNALGRDRSTAPD